MRFHLALSLLTLIASSTNANAQDKLLDLHVSRATWKNESKTPKKNGDQTIYTTVQDVIGLSGTYSVIKDNKETVEERAVVAPKVFDSSKSTLVTKWDKNVSDIGHSVSREACVKFKNPDAANYTDRGGYLVIDEIGRSSYEKKFSFSGKLTSECITSSIYCGTDCNTYDVRYCTGDSKTPKSARTTRVCTDGSGKVISSSVTTTDASSSSSTSSSGSTAGNSPTY